MKRRELVKLITIATGSALAIPLSGTLLTACKRVKKESDSDYTLSFFKEKEFSFLKEILNVLLPKTDSPSATDVGVHQIMDTIVGSVYSPEQQNVFMELFHSLSVYTENKELATAVGQLLNSDKEADAKAKAGLLDIKQQAVAYYVSTEEIATNYLNYLPIPGAYEPCISLESVNGKAWAI
ncbi:gluconate 2-dehydrogenase subunit 3 family protein [uncultured Eudoraea sp.]|uniref:gluconate 2-dehydrogenase subunit 3 family protein n=1 Tax=uncultured Eudoraea sp. TaxID=1035614 RepID=UPI002622CE5A|nr:gluconate 2-dehydrogenase subunit 3 family protein [uncultured Eudoraea sp.]